MAPKGADGNVQDEQDQTAEQTEGQVPSDPGDGQEAATGNSATDQTTAPAAEAEKVKPRKTEYATIDSLTVLDELPDNAKAVRKPGSGGGRGRSKIYFNLLEAIAGDNDNLAKWHFLARFGTHSGAHTVATQLTKQLEGKILTVEQGEMKAEERPDEVKGFILADYVREIPDFSDQGWSWEFTSRKVASERPGAKDGERESVLYARLIETAELEKIRAEAAEKEAATEAAKTANQEQAA